jgi:predicted  nucleic acid-binding Zn-ribbon protein
LKLPTLRNCPECSDKYFEYRQETTNRRSVHERIGRIHPSDDRRQKIIEVINHPERRKRIRDGLIKKKRNTNTSGKKDNGAHLA